MWGFVPAFEPLKKAATLAVLLASVALFFAPQPAVSAAPKRVVSINLCTDQLAMLIADQGQLLSVSILATDPRSSAMVEAAAAYPANHGLAEEIYLMQPDLVLAGRFSARASVEMLERLSIPVEIFDPAYSLDDVTDRLRQMGVVLGRQDHAEAMIADFKADLASYRTEVAARPRAALYYANGYTAGDKTLAGQILTTAGLANIAAEAGFDAAGFLPLEVLAMAQPDTVITSRPYPGGSRSEEIMRHPVIEELRRARPESSVTDSDWVCGTPFVLRAIKGMVELRDEIEEAQP